MVCKNKTRAWAQVLVVLTELLFVRTIVRAKKKLELGLGFIFGLEPNLVLMPPSSSSHQSLAMLFLKKKKIWAQIHF